MFWTRVVSVVILMTCITVLYGAYTEKDVSAEPFQMKNTPNLDCINEELVITNKTDLMADCSNRVHGLTDFDSYYQKAVVGESINCSDLVATVGWVETSNHGIKRNDVSVLDYITLTGNDFTSLNICHDELTTAVQTMCNEVRKIKSDVASKNKGLEPVESAAYLHGYSLSGAQFKYCKDSLN